MAIIRDFLLRLSILAVFAGLGAGQAPKIGTCSVFPADNIWNTRIDLLPVHPNSSTWVTTIGASAHMHPDFGSGIDDGGPRGIPYVTVPGTQTKYPPTFQYQSDGDIGPYAIPLNAPIEGGSASTGDRHAIAIDTDHCILYEIYAAYPQAASWKGGSGAIFNLTSDALRPSTWTSADAAGLPIFPGLVRYDEIVAGEIRHAIRFTVPQTLHAFVWPARHQASSLTAAKYPPMGARFRLKQSFNISGYSATNKIILTALKRYGMMLADNGSSWYISGAPDERWNNDDLHVLNNIAGSNFEAVDVSPLMVDPNSGQARQTSVAVTVTPPSATLAVNGQLQFADISAARARWGTSGNQRPAYSENTKPKVLSTEPITFLNTRALVLHPYSPSVIDLPPQILVDVSLQLFVAEAFAVGPFAAEFIVSDIDTGPIIKARREVDRDWFTGLSLYLVRQDGSLSEKRK